MKAKALSMSEEELSALANEFGYRIEKSRAIDRSQCDFGKYRLIESSLNFVVILDESDAGLYEIESFLVELKQSQRPTAKSGQSGVQGRIN